MKKKINQKMVIIYFFVTICRLNLNVIKSAIKLIETCFKVKYEKIEICLENVVLKVCEIFIY